MVDLHDVLDYYFEYERNYNPKHKELEDTFYENIVKQYSSLKVISKQYDVYGIAGHIHEYEKGIEYWIYSSCLKINFKSDKNAKFPLNKIADCEYMYYGLYLSCLAYINGGKVKRLVLVNSPDSHKLYKYRYRPDLALLMLNHYKNDRT